MAKGLSVKPIEPLIAETFTNMHKLDAKITAKEVQAEVRTRLKDTYKDKELPPDWPSVSAVGKVITKIKPKLGLDPEDNLWSVSALTDYDIPPEALPTVMKAWAKALEDDVPLTIRQVKWVVSLYCIEDNIGDLIIIALEYANREKATKLTGAYPDKPQNMSWLWFGDAILYLGMTGDDSLLKKCMKSMKWRTAKDISLEMAELKLKKGGKSK